MKIEIADLVFSNERLWMITDIYDNRYDLISIDYQIKNWVGEHTIKEMRKWYLEKYENH